MGKLHLICNAHLDPVWLWRWDEGAAEAISTFRVAAEFCETYDGYVFNHNEALLYQWVEEYEPALFSRIQKLVETGKWHIMGGWYLQPDCNMPGGESFVRQILKGKTYFMEKFGKEPAVAVNFDPFGHTRGLVQILKKSGYDAYMFMRPDPMEHGNFKWVGFDGSAITAHRVYKGYNTLKGEAVKKIKEYMEDYPDAEEAMMTWGVGNHGGGASRKDLEAIQKLCAESDWEIVHSTPEDYFKSVDIHTLPEKAAPLRPSMVGCYTSMVRIKQLHRRLENAIYMGEKMAGHASILCGMEYPQEQIDAALEDLLFCEFHDVLPGTMIKDGEEDSIAKLSHGLDIMEKVMGKAFFAVTAGQPRAKEGEIPILAYNPHPYKVHEILNCEYQLDNQNWNEDEFTVAHIYQNGQLIASQHIKERSSLNLDWRKSVLFEAELEPSSINRFDCKLEVVKNYRRLEFLEENEHFTYENDKIRVSINTGTGLLDEYKVYGRDYLKNNAARLEVFADNEDPWGMTATAYRQKCGAFALMTEAEANSFAGYPQEQFPPVRVIENGDVCLVVQALFTYNRSAAVVEYKIPKNGTDIDVDVTLFWNETNKMVKYAFPAAQGGTFMGQTAYGTEALGADEEPFQKWCGLFDGNAGFAVINEGIYGGDCVENELRLSLLHSPVYSGHPLENRQVVPHDRFLKHIDMGERSFRIRLAAGERLAGDVDYKAAVFNERPYVLSFFPSGAGTQPGKLIELDNTAVLVSAFKKAETADAYILRLYNSQGTPQKAAVQIPGLRVSPKVELGGYEVKSFCVSDGTLVETDLLERPVRH